MGGRVPEHQRHHQWAKERVHVLRMEMVADQNLPAKFGKLIGKNFFFSAVHLRQGAEPLPFIVSVSKCFSKLLPELRELLELQDEALETVKDKVVEAMRSSGIEGLNEHLQMAKGPDVVVPIHELVEMREEIDCPGGKMVIQPLGVPNPSRLTRGGKSVGIEVWTAMEVIPPYYAEHSELRQCMTLIVKEIVQRAAGLRRVGSRTPYPEGVTVKSCDWHEEWYRVKYSTFKRSNRGGAADTGKQGYILIPEKTYISDLIHALCAVGDRSLMPVGIECAHKTSITAEASTFRVTYGSKSLRTIQEKGFPLGKYHVGGPDSPYFQTEPYGPSYQDFAFIGLTHLECEEGVWSIATKEGALKERLQAQGMNLDEAFDQTILNASKAGVAAANTKLATAAKAAVEVRAAPKLEAITANLTEEMLYEYRRLARQSDGVCVGIVLFTDKREGRPRAQHMVEVRQTETDDETALPTLSELMHTLAVHIREPEAILSAKFKIHGVIDVAVQNSHNGPTMKDISVRAVRALKLNADSPGVLKVSFSTGSNNPHINHSVSPSASPAVQKPSPAVQKPAPAHTAETRPDPPMFEPTVSPSPMPASTAVVSPSLILTAEAPKARPMTFSVQDETLIEGGFKVGQPGFACKGCKMSFPDYEEAVAHALTCEKIVKPIAEENGFSLDQVVLARVPKPKYDPAAAADAVAKAAKKTAAKPSGIKPPAAKTKAAAPPKAQKASRAPQVLTNGNVHNNNSSLSSFLDCSNHRAGRSHKEKPLRKPPHKDAGVRDRNGGVLRPGTPPALPALTEGAETVLAPARGAVEDLAPEGGAVTGAATDGAHLLDGARRRLLSLTLSPAVQAVSLIPLGTPRGASVRRECSIHETCLHVGRESTVCTYKPNLHPELPLLCGRAPNAASLWFGHAHAPNAASPGMQYHLAALRPQGSFYLAECGTARGSATRCSEGGGGWHVVPGSHEAIGVLVARPTLIGGCGLTSGVLKGGRPPAVDLRIVAPHQNDQDPGASATCAAVTGTGQQTHPPLPRGVPNAPTKRARLSHYIPFYAGNIFDSTLGYPGEGPAMSKMAHPKTLAHMGVLDSIQTQMEKSWANTDFTQFIASLDLKDSTIAKRQEKSNLEWLGHDMSVRPAHSGLRVITVNVAKKLMDIETTTDHVDDKGHTSTTSTKYFDHLLEYMTSLEGDVMIINEPGLIWNCKGLIESMAAAHHMEALVATTEHSKAAGLVVILGPQWRKVKTKMSIMESKHKRLMNVEFKAKEKKGRRPLQHLHLSAIYGLNGPETSQKNRQESSKLWETVIESVECFRSTHPLGSVVVAGDFNAAKSSKLDTNRKDAHGDSVEKDSHVLTALEGIGLCDTFRIAHPDLQAWTREPTGDLQHVQASRRIDAVMASDELANNLAMRSGIQQDFFLRTDHMPTVTDFPLDCAGLAENVIPVWDPHKVTKTMMNEDISDADTAAFNLKLSAAMQRITNNKELYSTSNQLFEGINSSILEAATGTIATKKTLTYPKKVSKLKHYTANDYFLRQWRKQLRRALRATNDKDLSKQKRALKNAEWKLSAVPDEIEIPVFSSFTCQASLKEALRTTITCVNARLEPQAVRQRAAEMSAAVKRRNALFEQEQGKGKGKFLQSIFKTARKNHSLAWARKQNGELAITPQEVGECVRDKFQAWFDTVVPVEERWGSWEKMLEMDTSDMDNTPRQIAPGLKMGFADFVEECYNDPTVLQQAHDQDWWGHMLQEITNDEVAQAIKDTTSNTAQGKSQVHVNMLKAVSEHGALTTLFNSFLTDRRVPDNMNVALLRLLPKTDDGLADLDRTRPIALMETLGKLYERIIIKRVMQSIEQFNILDLGQFGALPEAGTAPPLRMLHEVLQDAKLSKSELHVIALDLKKAFDTCEYWSQALSWRALGMPREVINVLVNLDAGSNNPGDPHEGPGAKTSVILDAGHTTQPFTHGREVRQGPVGGPIKWVVFMNAWLKWIKKTMRGKGYAMSSTRKDDVPVEVLAQMFVDDSIWFANSATHAQELARRCELFCDFHKVIINREKSDYVSLNDAGHQLIWTPRPGSRAKVFQRSGSHGPVKAVEHDGRTIKYLGVLFDAQAGWKSQIRALERKQKELTSKLKFTSISVEQAVYAINTKIVPAIAYSLQVANIPDSILKKWDKEHCNIVRRAGKLNAACAIQDELFHLPKTEGGLGLISLRLQREATLISAQYHALNDSSIKAGASLLARVVAAGTIHQNAQSSLHNHVKRALERLHMTLTRTSTRDRMRYVGERDVKVANSHQQTWLPVDIYTDGGTATKSGGPSSAWGVAIQRDNGNVTHSAPTNHGTIKINNKLKGEQNNDIAEAHAVLRALMAVNTHTDVNIYIDNLGVVQKAEGLADQGSRTTCRSKLTGRSTWRRILSLMHHRNESGAHTNYVWIHSHVDDPSRIGWNDKWLRPCGCGGITVNNRKECDPEHKHHVGNALADELATEALDLPTSCDALDDPMNGEEDYHLRVRGEHVQSNIGDAIKNQQIDAILESFKASVDTDTGATRGAKNLEEWQCRWHVSCPAVNKKLMRNLDTSRRFRLKLWSGALPTYSNIHKRTHPHTSAHIVYGDEIEGGKCRACDMAVEETI